MNAYGVVPSAASMSGNPTGPETLSGMDEDGNTGSKSLTDIYCTMKSCSSPSSEDSSEDKSSIETLKQPPLANAPPKLTNSPSSSSVDSSEGKNNNRVVLRHLSYPHWPMTHLK